MAVLPTGIGPVTGGGTPENAISRSLRFNSLDSAHLTRTLSSSGNRKKWTMSVWQKGFVSSRNGGNQNAFLSVGTGSNIGDYRANIVFNAENFYFAYVQIQTAGIISATATPVYRDPSAWYHFMCVFDSDNATLNDRVRLYVNGSRVDASVTCPQGQQTDINNSSYQHKIGILQDYTGNPTYYADMFLAEQYFVDGQNLLPSDFGETDSATGIWKPKPYTGTYGTNGFYLNFSDNSGTTSTTLGKDNSGNGNNWTPNNFSVTAGVNNDSMVDSPTAYGTDTGVGGEVRGNYCTLNPLDIGGGTLSNGNLQYTNTDTHRQVRSTFQAPKTGKFYCEATVLTATGSTVACGFGLCTPSVSLQSNAFNAAGFWQLYTSSDFYINRNGTAFSNSSNAGNYVLLQAGDTIGLAIDLENNQAWVGKNNVWYDGSNGVTGNPSAGTNATFTSLPDELAVFAHCYSNTLNCNFGQRPFAYTAPSGFKALCTQNLPTPTIGATSTTQANDYFNAVLYNGTNANGNSVTGVGFQPDFVWTKSRNTAYGHNLFDAVRGVYKNLGSNGTYAEETNTDKLVSFNSDGFTVNADQIGSGGCNYGTGTYVAWNWNAGGSNATNTAGTITSTVRANTTSGFSIVTYTGTGANATVGHGLGVAPQMVIAKDRQTANPWLVWHTGIAGTEYLIFNTTAAKGTLATVWNSTIPTSTVFSLGSDGNVNPSGKNCVAYCFAPVAGYSAFGSYVGNGSADGPFVYLGFRPRYVLIKRTDTTNNWFVSDSSIAPYNLVENGLYPNLVNAEGAINALDFLSNGFKPRANYAGANASGGTYIYAAFAESPFKYSLAR
jgi:hypothetical protein